MLRSISWGLRPSPTESEPCGSKSTSSTLRPYSASEAPRLMVVVVLPTPPFWLHIETTRARVRAPMGPGSGKAGIGRPVGPITSSAGCAPRSRTVSCTGDVTTGSSGRMKGMGSVETTVVGLLGWGGLTSGGISPALLPDCQGLGEDPPLFIECTPSSTDPIAPRPSPRTLSTRRHFSLRFRASLEPRRHTHNRWVQSHNPVPKSVYEPAVE